MSLPLPDDHVAPSSPAEIRANIAWPCVMLVLANFFAIWWLADHTKNATTYMLHSKWKLLLDLRQPVDWLVVGDSSGNQGLVTPMLEQHYGGRALNLCTVGDMGSLDDLWMVEEHVKRLGPPKALLVVHVYDAWPRKDSSMRDVLLSYRPPLKDWKTREPRLKLRSRDKRRLFAAEYIFPWIPIYSQSTSMRELAIHPVKAMGPPPFALDSTGFLARPTANPAQVAYDMLDHKKDLSEETFKVSDINRACLEKILAISKEKNFPVFIINAPAYHELGEMPSFKVYNGDLQKYLAETIAPYPNARVLFPQPLQFPDTQMENADHLTIDGAHIYTAKVIQEIDKSGLVQGVQAP